jgi:ATP-dependent Clp protease protease subunit
MAMIPNVIKRESGGERAYDLFSRLLADRIILLQEEINDNTAAVITAQLLYLDSEDPGKDISLYINSPGGSVSAGLAILDTMDYIKSDVSTVCMGIAASMGAVLLGNGAKGKRLILPNAEVMIHQPLGGTQGQATDIEIAAKHILKTKENLTRIMAANCGRDFDEVAADMDRDNWMDASEALRYGIVDKVLVKDSLTK